MLLKVRISRSLPQYCISTEVDRNTTWQQVSSGTRVTHHQWHTYAKWGIVEQNCKKSKNHFSGRN